MPKATGLDWARLEIALRTWDAAASRFAVECAVKFNRTWLTIGSITNNVATAVQP